MNQQYYIKRYPIIIGLVLLVCGTLFGWLVYNNFGTTNIFYLSIIIYIISSFLFIIGAHKYEYRKMWSILLFLSASLLLVLGFFDFYLITFRYDTSGPGGENVITHRNWFNTFVSKNEGGFWERSLAEFANPPARKNQFILAVVGDSFTWGQGIQGKQSRFTERLEKKVNSVSARKRATVLNFGKGGADTLQEVKIVRKFVSKVYPDIVLICYLTNDIPVEHKFIDSSVYNTIGEKLATITPTINFIYWRLIGPRKYKQFGIAYMQKLVEAYKTPEIFDNHMRDLYKLFSEIKKIGARPIFVLLPFPQMWSLFPQQVRDDTYGKIRKTVMRARVPVIDLTYIEEKYSLDEFVVNSFDAHPNEKMHEEFAEGIYQWFLKDNESKSGLLMKRKRLHEPL